MRQVQAYPGTICVCIDNIKQDWVYGRFYHRYGGESVAFHNLFQMVMKAERIFDSSGIPQACVNERSFRKKKSRTDIRRRLQLKNTEQVTEHDGENATFYINVQYRQNASWQGKITWMEGKESCYFRSVLELIKLMDSTIRDKKFKIGELEETEVI